MPYTKIPISSPQPEPSEENGFGRSVLLITGAWIAADEIAVELDTGEHVAVACIAADRDFASQTLYLTTTARVLDAEGGTAYDNGQNPAHIATAWIHGANTGQIQAAGGLDALRTELLRLALGETPRTIGGGDDSLPLLPLPNDVLQTISIRRAIAASALLASSNDSNGLL